MEHAPNGDAAPYVARIAGVGRCLPTTRLSTEALMGSSQSLTQKLYEAAAQADREATGGPSQPSDDDVVDAEIVDEGDDS